MSTIETVIALIGMFMGVSALTSGSFSRRYNRYIDHLCAYQYLGCELHLISGTFPARRVVTVRGRLLALCCSVGESVTWPLIWLYERTLGRPSVQAALYHVGVSLIVLFFVGVCAVIAAPGVAIVGMMFQR